MAEMMTQWNPRLGALLGDDGCRFRVWAPNAERVELHLLGADDRCVTLQAEAHGYYSAFVEAIEPGQRYCYRLDGVDYPDPASRYQPDGVSGPSAVVDRRYAWQSLWFGRPQQAFVIYELHIGTFTTEGTFTAAIAYLDDLAELGITAIELMPVVQFAGTRNWGYDGVLQFAVQHSYGGPDGLKQFVDACHLRGIAVLLDVVYNHFGPEGNCYPCYGPYLTDHYKTPWGEALNFDGPQSDPVRAFFVENVLYWFYEYRLDGLRLDATHYMYDNRATHILQELAATVAEHRELASRHFVLIAESDTNDPRLLRPRNVGGIALDGQWNDDFHHTVHALLTNETGHYYAGYDTLGALVKALREGFVYTGQYSEFRKRSHGASSFDIPARQLIVFTQNHDQVGNRLPSERIACYLPFDALKLWIGLAALSPYLPMIFMGEEYAEPALFNFFTDFEGQELIDAINQGRKSQFGLGADADFPPPQAAATFEASRLNHTLKTGGKHRVMLEFHRTLFRLRREVPAMAALSKERMEVIGYEDELVLFWRRWQGENTVVAAYNLGAKPARAKLPIPTGRWHCLIDSAEPRWHADSADPLAAGEPVTFESTGEHSLDLAPYAFRVFSNE
jgi:maltooligosyltrehalose trehalohydrolase